MRAALLESVGHIVLVDMQRPDILEDDQVLIQAKNVGICGSEVHAYAGTHPYRKAPVVLGHEMAGVVISVGLKVSNIRVGDRVIVDPQWSCGVCQYCQRGEINLCPSKRVLGTPAWPGAFAEFVVVPHEAVYLLPDGLSFLQGCLIEPLTVAVHVAHRVGIEEGRSVGILGAGSIGGMVSGVCRTYGANPVIVADIRQHCLDASRERMGASHDFLLPDRDLTTKVRALTNDQGVDAVFIAADDVELVNRGIEMVKRGGAIVLIALLTHAPVQFKAYDIIAKEARIIGSNMCTKGDVVEAIRLTASGKVDVEGILTHVLPHQDVDRGMELAQTKQNKAIKVVLEY
jgi:L-iditol 2-dehydrogenase